LINKLIQLWRRLRYAIRRDQLDGELQEEMRFHLEMKIEENLAAGMPEQEARRAANAQFGNRLLLGEASRDVWVFRSVETLFQDLRFGWRLLMRSPVLTIVAALSLALGIGVNSMVFTFINSAMFRPLPLPDAGRLVRIQGDNTPAYSDYLAFRERAAAFAGLAAYDFDTLNLVAEATSGRVGVVKVSGNYFDVLGVKPVLGRSFSPDEDRNPGTQPVAVISYGLWQRRFGADPDVIGKPVTLQKESFTVIGVTPMEFTGVSLGIEHDLWIPMLMDARLRPEGNLVKSPDNYQVRVIGRLRPGASLAEAQAEVKTIAAAQDLTPKVRPFSDDPDEQVLTPSAVVPATIVEMGPRELRQAWLGVAGIMTAVGLVLLVACANVANLLLGRAAARRKEIAVRLAIGAGRWRVVRQLLTESILLSLMGGAGGLLLAQWGAGLLLALMSRFAPAETPAVFLDLSLDARVLCFTLLLSFVTGIAFGLVPALQISKPDLTSALKDQSLMLPGSRRRLSFRNALVVTQVSVSLLLLVPAGLLIRNMQVAQTSDCGFPTAGRYVVSVDLNGTGMDENRQRLFQAQLLDRVRTQPEIRSASLSQIIPLSGALDVIQLEIEGEPPDSEGEDVATERHGSMWVLDQPRSLFLNSVDTGYFETMGIPLLYGRDFTERDNASSPDVVVVNETLARRLSPHGSATGRRLIERDYAGKKARLMEVIGVVKDTKYQWPSERPRYFAYRPIRQSPVMSAYLTFLSSGDPQSAFARVRSVLQALDPNVPLNNIRSMDEVINQRVGSSKLLIWLSGSLGLLATMLAAIGIYGVMAYAVSGRTKEIGIRMALGARGGDVVRMVLREGLAVVLVGVLIGLALSAVCARVMSSLLYGVSPTDPLAFGSVAGLMMVVALAACYLPARRATKVDPMIALRYE
jgi:macrolide transport system ATP-binding/permease protein